MVLKLNDVLFRPVFMVSVLAAISAFSLMAALFAEAFLGLEPCILCIYQRVPFLMVLVACVFVLWCRKYTNPVILSSGLLLMVNSMVAAYHSGVERHWWTSKVEGCAVPQLGATDQTILQNILSAPTGNCSEIPWADPFLGLSMANYNVFLCAGLAAWCALAYWKTQKV